MEKSIVTICNKKKNKIAHHKKVWVVKKMSWKRDIFFSNYELEMQNYSVKNVLITAKRIVFQCEKRKPIYCCPYCRQQIFSVYDSSIRVIEDLPMSGKRVFPDLPIFRLYCPTCKRCLRNTCHFFSLISVTRIVWYGLFTIYVLFRLSERYRKWLVYTGIVFSE